MTPFINGFADELVKVGADSVRVNVDLKRAYEKARRKGGKRHADRELSSLQRHRRRTSGDYLTSMALGSLATPAAIVGSRRMQKILRKHLPKVHAKPIPSVTVPEISAGVARGALGGAIVQMLRDRFAGKRN